MLRRSIALALTLAAALVAGDARALGPVDLEVAAKAGLGTDPLGNGNPNPLGFGIGGRAGLSFFRFYGGVALMYYFGASQNESFGDVPSLSVSEHALMYGVEAGYNWYFLDKTLTIRPQLGVGNLTISSSVGALPQGVNPLPNSVSNLYLEPGVTALIALGQWFVGADGNLLVLPSIQEPGATSSSTDVAFTVHAQVGLKF
ncbi:MAG: hypothetical protein ABTD50_19210 [Polyangiaceae bacterium]|jgi:hypothetical protein